MRTVLILLCAIACQAYDWPQWRGPRRDGVAAGFREPKVWPEKLNLKWKVTVGEGHSSPVVLGDRIYLHSRQGEREVISALRLDSGQTIWQDGYRAEYKVNPAAARHGKGVKSTPVVQEGRLYAFGIGGILSCYDTASGKLVWRKDFREQFPKTSPAFGVALSPVVDQGMVIVHLGGDGNGALTALDTKSGAVKWSWKGDGPAYASPMVFDLGGVRQVVTQSQKHIIGVSEASGELLWQIPFTTAYEQNVVTPVEWRDTLIFSGLEKGIFAIKVIRQAGKWATEKIWNNSGVAMYMNSPVIVGDVLFGLSHRNKGQYFALDPKNGATLWTSEGRNGDNAAIVSAGSVLLLLNNEAELTVARPSAKGLEAVRKYTVAESPTWAHPVPVEGGVLVKDATTLARWSFE